jgi:hypothetical protein
MPTHTTQSATHCRSIASHSWLIGQPQDDGLEVLLAAGVILGAGAKFAGHFISDLVMSVEADSSQQTFGGVRHRNCQIEPENKPEGQANKESHYRISTTTELSHRLLNFRAAGTHVGRRFPPIASFAGLSQAICSMTIHLQRSGMCDAGPTPCLIGGWELVIALRARD